MWRTTRPHEPRPPHSLRKRALECLEPGTFPPQTRKPGLLVKTRTDSNVSGLDHDQSPEQFLFKLPHQADDAFRHFSTSRRREAEQYNAGTLPSRRVDQPTEILVFGQKDPFLLRGHLRHQLVRGTSGHFDNCQNVVTLRPQNANNCEIATLVRQKSHLLPPLNQCPCCARPLCYSVSWTSSFASTSAAYASAA